MKTIIVKRSTFLSSNYSIILDNKAPSYSTMVKFTLKDPQEIVLRPESNRADDAIHMKPVGKKKTGYGEEAEYSLQIGGGEPFGFLVIKGRVNPVIHMLDEKRMELGILKQSNALYSLIRTLLQKILPNFYICKNQKTTLFTASEIYTPLMCRVKLQMKEVVHNRMDEFAICAGLWVACSPSF